MFAMNTRNGWISFLVPLSFVVLLPGNHGNPPWRIAPKPKSVTVTLNFLLEQ